MDWDIFLSVLKWTGVIILTGFVAQFGKQLADYLIERFRKKKDPGSEKTPSAGTAPGHGETAGDRAKALKKQKKLEAKIRKKGK